MSIKHKGTETFKKVTVYRSGTAFITILAAFYLIVAIVLAIKAL